jgi:hypothetical protein
MLQQGLLQVKALPTNGAVVLVGWSVHTLQMTTQMLVTVEGTATQLTGAPFKFAMKDVVVSLQEILPGK